MSWRAGVKEPRMYRHSHRSPKRMAMALQVMCEALERRRLLSGSGATLAIAPHDALMHRAAANAPTDVTPPLPAPGDFAGTIDNPYFPLFPGSTYIYTGIQDG